MNVLHLFSRNDNLKYVYTITTIDLSFCTKIFIDEKHKNCLSADFLSFYLNRWDFASHIHALHALSSWRNIRFSAHLRILFSSHLAPLLTNRHFEHFRMSWSNIVFEILINSFGNKFSRRESRMSEARAYVGITVKRRREKIN